MLLIAFQRIDWFIWLSSQELNTIEGKVDQSIAYFKLVARQASMVFDALQDLPRVRCFYSFSLDWFCSQLACLVRLCNRAEALLPPPLLYARLLARIFPSILEPDRLTLALMVVARFLQVCGGRLAASFAAPLTHRLFHCRPPRKYQTKMQPSYPYLLQLRTQRLNPTAYSISRHHVRRRGPRRI